MEQGGHFQLVGKRFFAGQQAFPMEIAVHQHDGGCVPVERINMGRNLLDSCPLGGVEPPVAGDHFIFVFDAVHRTNDQRCEDAKFPDTVYKRIHFGVILHIERMPLERMKGMDGNGNRFNFHFVFPLN